MPPKRRKIETETKEGDSSSADTPAVQVEVKTERLSQAEDEKTVSQNLEEKPTTGASRTLRPRKSTTCYVEKDSPEIEFEEKQTKKGPRRKRRCAASSEDVHEEKESKIKRSESGKDEEGTVVASLADPATSPLEAESTVVSCLALNSDASEKQNESKGEATATATKDDGAEQSKSSVKKKRPTRPRPKAKKAKPIPAEIVPLDSDVVPKTEPLSPSSLAGKKESLKEGSTGTVDDKPINPEKPKPKKRIRNRKPAIKPAVTTEDKTLEDKSDSQEQPVIKQETGETEGESKESADGESKTEVAKGKEDEGKLKSAATPAVPKKKPARKRAKPQEKKILETEKTVGGNNDDDEPLKTEKEIKTEAENDEQKSVGGDTQKPTVRKRVKSRPKKPTVSISAKTTSDNGESNPNETSDKAEEEGEKKNCLVKENQDGTDDNAVPNEPKCSLPASRKPFFRGRRSKSISARAGRKEIIHREETIDPEDIRGFEHVDKYVTPPGVRLPKFWDSEDEMSEDENNDNFRRIMCGFGTNCRIHEVIRPASEIVRRLKELQNTFGSSKSLPLFQKDDLEFIEETQISPSAEAFFRKDRERTITWHTDPSFFKYANNYPSRCK